MAHDDEHLHDEPQSFVRKYVWSQDHKVIAVQYASVAIIVGLIGVLLSNLMRLQIGFPGQFAFITPERFYQFVTMHGMIMANAREEIDQARHFDYVVINALFETALFDLKAIVHAQRLKYARLQRTKAAVFHALGLG